MASLLPVRLKVRIKDVKGNGISGMSVSFSGAGVGGTLSTPSATTDSSGYASTSYTTGTKSGVVSITASAAGLSSVFKETVLAGPPSSPSIYSGNMQKVKAGFPTSKLLQVNVADQYGNPVPGISVNFDDRGAGGSFSSNPVVTNTAGIAGARYTAPLTPGAITVTASVPGAGSVAFAIKVN